MSFRTDRCACGIMMCMCPIPFSHVCVQYPPQMCVSNTLLTCVCVSNTLLTCVCPIPSSHVCVQYPPHMCVSNTLLTCVCPTPSSHVCVSNTLLTCVCVQFPPHMCMCPIPSSHVYVSNTLLTNFWIKPQTFIKLGMKTSSHSIYVLFNFQSRIVLTWWVCKLATLGKHHY